MNRMLRQYATFEDWHLVEMLWCHPDFWTIDEHGNPTNPYKQELYRRLKSFVDSLNWEPMIIEEGGKVGLFNQFANSVMLPAIYDSFSELPSQSPEVDIVNCNIIAQLDGEWGVVSSDGENRTIIPFIYDKISRYEYDGMFILDLGGKLGISTSEGKVLLDCSADKIWYDEDLGIDLYSIDTKIGLIRPKTDAIFDSVKRCVGQNYVIASKKGQDFYISAIDGRCISVETSSFGSTKLLQIFYM